MLPEDGDEVEENKDSKEDITNFVNKVENTLPQFVTQNIT